MAKWGNQGIPNQVPWLGLVSLFQIWDFCGYSLKLYPKISKNGNPLFFPVISCTVLGLIWMFCFNETLIYTKGFKGWTIWSKVGSLWSRILENQNHTLSSWSFWWYPVVLFPQDMPNPFPHLCIPVLSILCCYCPLSSSFLTTVQPVWPNWKMPSI